MLNIGKNRELFWDDYIVNTELTTAESRLGGLVNKGKVMVHDKPWEGDGCNFYCLVNIDGRYRMYYNAWNMIYIDENTGKKTHSCTDVKIAVMESDDGIHWERPNLGIIEFNGSKDNNLILTSKFLNLERNIDNFYVFIDDNPNRVIPERFKAIMAHWRKKDENGVNYKTLDCMVSDDGLHWKFSHVITDNGAFDSMNTIQWNKALGKYLCFYRDFHFPGSVMNDEEAKAKLDWNELVRDIRVIESEDCIHWTESVQLDFLGAEDVPLYTNVITPYYRAPQVMTGFPSRYIERKQWTKNFDRLSGSADRAMRCAIHPRYGLTVTDCVFMCSRDGYKWMRPDEAFARPEPEDDRNWVYGDCYPAVGMIETPSDIEGADSEISMYMFENHWMGIPAVLYRYTIRKDGFMSRHAGIKPEKIVTKEFTYDGDTMLLNFATSARGYLYITIRDVESGKELHSGELFGNRCDRIVDFDGEISELAGKKVVMEMELCDGDVYAFKFE